MNKIATIEKLIIEGHAILNALSVEYCISRTIEYVNGISVIVHWKYHLPESIQIRYRDLKVASERFVYQMGDMVSLQKIRKSIDDIDDLLKDGEKGEKDIDISEKVESCIDDDDIEEAKEFFKEHFNSILDCLSRMKSICEEELSNKVFVVHGRSELLIAQTDSFLQRIGYDPIFLRDQPNQGQTIIEKLESNTDVPFAIVLYTGCDEGRFNDDNEPLKPRARQNVVFEHGYLNAKLGRNRVCALVEEGVEYPGDLSGVVYIPIDKNGKWKIKVAKEMKAVGLNVDINKVNI